MNRTTPPSRWIASIALLALLLGALPGAAQGRRGPGARAAEPEFMKALFPPDLIMRHAGEIDLSEAQREGIKAAVSQTQSEVFDLQWTLREAAEGLRDLVEADRIDEEATLAAAERVMETEGRVKRAHLRMLIRIKNTLRPEQRSRLTALRAAEPGRPGS